MSLLSIVSNWFPLFVLAMTTLIPRDPYSKEELERLYPKGLKLQLVQVVSRADPCACTLH